MTPTQFRDALLESMLIANEGRRAAGLSHTDAALIRELANNAAGALCLEYVLVRVED